MNKQSNDMNVKNLCSRKLWELLKNAEWQSNTERLKANCQIAATM